MEVSYDQLQVECGLSDLEIMQLQDAQYLATMEMTYQASLETCKVENKIRESEQHLDTVLENINIKSSLNTEQLFCIIVRGYTKPCGSCMVYRNFKDGTDPIKDYCPHLICSEWSLLPKLRSISKAFWKKFINSQVGKSLQLCLVPPFAYQRRWTYLFTGYSKKIHLVSGYLNYDCPCLHCETLKSKMKTWLRRAGLDPRKNISITS